MGLHFEDKLLEMENKISELEKFSFENDFDFGAQIKAMKEELIRFKTKSYETLTPWDKLTLARMAQRPTSIDYIERIFDDFIELHGDRFFGDDKAIIGGIGKLNTTVVTVIGEQKGRDIKENIERNFGMPHPEGYRKALRLMKQAEKFNRPVICLIDTPGAYCGIGAEERGQAETIAQNLMQMAQLAVPVICVLIGEGSSGGALAIGVGDRIIMLEHSVYSILSPEGFASILWKDSKRAKEAADIMKITAADLKKMKIIDEIIEEPLGGAHRDVDDMAGRIKSCLARVLEELKHKDIEVLLNERHEKFRAMGC